jgi:FKBP-type peptidyl-prolyl cis-trans isomerase
MLKVRGIFNSQTRPSDLGTKCVGKRTVCRGPSPLMPFRPCLSNRTSEETETMNKDVIGRTKPKRLADSTDAVASFLTRRFGIAGGLAWLGFLAVGSLGEQLKTRWEVAEAEKATQEITSTAQVEVTLPSGLRYTDLRVGGGQSPPRGYLVVVDYVGKANEVVFEDTKLRGKPIVYFFGGRPFTAGMCEGTEQALATMKAGGKRRVFVPASLGFGNQGAVLRPTEHVPDKQGAIPPGADLEYELELVRVSIPPS